MTERELIIGCLKGDPPSQEALFRRYAGKMMTVSRRYARHHMEAEDILQDAFVKVFKNMNKFQGKGSFEGWIRRIVVNTALKNYQKLSYQKEDIGTENVVEKSEDPKVYSNLGAEDLLKLVSELPEGYKIVFNLYAIEGYSHKEISELLEIKESTSRSQLVKARKMLQAKIANLQKIVYERK